MNKFGVEFGEGLNNGVRDLLMSNKDACNLSIENALPLLKDDPYFKILFNAVLSSQRGLQTPTQSTPSTTFSQISQTPQTPQTPQNINHERLRGKPVMDCLGYSGKMSKTVQTKIEDFLNVTTPGGKVPRWKVLGRNTGLSVPNTIVDAYELIQWLNGRIDLYNFANYIDEVYGGGNDWKDLIAKEYLG